MFKDIKQKLLKLSVFIFILYRKKHLNICTASDADFMCLYIFKQIFKSIY